MRPGREIVERKLAKITKTYLGWEDHGLFTFVLSLDYGGMEQGFGTYSLDEPVHENGKFVGRRGSAAGMQLLMATIKACGVESWEKVKGRTVYALIDGSLMVRGLAPLPTEPGEEFHVDDIFGGGE